MDIISYVMGQQNANPTQTKSVTITQNGSTTVNPDAGYSLSQVGVTVNVEGTPKEEVEGTTTITSNGTHTITPPTNKVFSSVTATVNVPNPSSGSLSITENGTYDVTEKAIAEVNVPSAELNIAYGQTAPTDTTKLWVKSSAPSSVKFSDFGGSQNDITKLTANLYEDYYAIDNTNHIVYLIHKGGGIKKFSLDKRTLKSISNKNITSRSNCGICYNSNKIYCFGGTNSFSYSSTTDEIKIYDISSNTVSTSSVRIPNRAWGCNCCSVGQYIYGFGGNNGSFVSEIWKYDTVNDTISTIAYLTNARPEIALVPIGDKIYLFGGYPDSNAIECFDTTTNTFIPKTATLNNGRCYIGSCNVGNIIYLISGKANDSTTYNYFETYDTINDTITKVNVNPNRSYNNGFAIGYENAILYLENETAVAIYSPLTTLQENNLLIKTSDFLNKVDIINNFQIKIEEVYKGNASNEAEVVEAYLYDEDEEEWVLI